MASNSNLTFEVYIAVITAWEQAGHGRRMSSLALGLSFYFLNSGINSAVKQIWAAGMCTVLDLWGNQSGSAMYF